LIGSTAELNTPPSPRDLACQISVQIEQVELFALLVVDAILPFFAMGVSSVLDGTQSPDEFNALANALVDDSLRGWAWKPCCKVQNGDAV
jgi:hypothetical protein